MKIPLFDLDGTLLQSGRGNKPHRDSFAYALKTVYDLLNASFSDIVADGMIDPQILVTIAMLHGISEKEAMEKLPRAIQAEIEYYFAHKDEEHSKAHTGAKNLLELLAPQIHCGVLTGNTEPIGWEKLQQAGLKDSISFGAFGNMAMKRVDLIPIAQKIYQEKFGEKRPITDFVIIGDTPKDIQCAKDGGISVIAVPTGNYSKEELEKEKPTLLIDTLNDTKAILSFLSS